MQNEVKSKRKHSKAIRTLCIALVLILIGSFGASLLQTSFFSVQVRDIYLETDSLQYLHALLFVPKTASKDNKCPVVITCHGWMNDGQMQDAACIELSRRGVAVIAMDAYSHGDSSNVPVGLMDSATKNGMGMQSLVDYCASGIMDFIDTGKIGLMGHSMGDSNIGGVLLNYGNKYAAAYKAAQAATSDGGTTVTKAEQASCDALYPVDSVLCMGNVDATVTRCFATLRANFAGLKSSNEETRVGAVSGAKFGLVHGDIALNIRKTVEPQATTAAKDTYYGNLSNNTLRVYYEPKSTHPLDTFLPNVTEKVIEWWQKVGFASTSLGVGDQTYLIKEFFNLAAMVGLFMLLLPIADLLMSVPCFANLRGIEGPKIPAPVGRKNKIIFWGGILLSAAVAYGAALLTNAFFVSKTFPAWGQIFPAGMGGNSYFFSATAMNIIMIWTILNTIWLVFWFWFNYRRDKKAGIRTPEMIGFKIRGREFLKTLGLSTAVIGLIYVVVWFCKWMFNTDFRFFTPAVQTFNAGKLWSYFQYLPFFFAFYLVYSLFVNGALRIEGMSERKNLLICVIANVLGILVMELIQYGSIWFNNGNCFYPGDWATEFQYLMIIWNLVLAPIYLRKFYKMTGKNWLGPLVVSSMFCLTGVTNTAISCFFFVK